MMRTGLLLGCSPQIRALDEDLRDAARSDARVLITGESGVGKELAARTIHAFSSRSSGPLVALNSAGVPDSLLESELFGHMRGSFTGAYRDKPGLFELARDGTVLLDEVGEMSLRMQSLLLRFLETGEIQPVGGSRPRYTVDVRVVAMTNRQLLDQIAAKEFREDLYYRLNVIHVVVPPLRERREDIPVLAQYFVKSCAEQYGLAAGRVLARGAGQPDRLRLAGERPRVEERDRADHRPRADAADCPAAICRPRCSSSRRR